MDGGGAEIKGKGGRSNSESLGFKIHACIYLWALCKAYF